MFNTTIEITEDINQIKKLISEGEKFTLNNFCYPGNRRTTHCGADKPEWVTWKTRSYNIIIDTSAPQSPATELANQAINTPTRGYLYATFQRLKEKMLKALKLTMESLKEDSFGELKKPSSKKSTSIFSNKIFVVHGHDTTLKTEVENFLNDIGLDPIILHKKPDEGQTIIEKFLKHSETGYAIILATPDDVVIGSGPSVNKIKKEEGRARQNVILEWGFFIGKLGRNRVCCIYKEGTVLLSSVITDEVIAGGGMNDLVY